MEYGYFYIIAVCQQIKLITYLIFIINFLWKHQDLTTEPVMSFWLWKSLSVLLFQATIIMTRMTMPGNFVLLETRYYELIECYFDTQLNQILRVMGIRALRVYFIMIFFFISYLIQYFLHKNVQKKNVNLSRICLIS